MSHSAMSSRTARMQSVAPYGFAPYGFTIPIAWRALVVRTAASDQSGVDVHLLFYCLGGAVFALVFFLYLFGAKSRFLPNRRTLNYFGSLCMAIASPAINFSALSNSSTGIVAGVALAAIGSCIVFLCWGDLFVHMSLGAATIYVFGSFGLSLLLVPFYPLLPNSAFVALMALSPVASMSLLGVSRQNLPNSSAAPSPHIYYNKDDLKSFWKFLAGIALYALILPLRTEYGPSNDILISLLFCLGACAVIALILRLLFAKGIVVSPERLFQTFLIIFAVSFFLSPFENPRLQEVIASLFFAATMLISMVLTLASIDVARHASVHPFVVLSAWGACYGAPRVLSPAIQAALEAAGNATGNDTSFALYPLFVIIIAVSFILGERPAGIRPIFSDLMPAYAAPTSFAMIDQRCHELAQSHGLTEREQEIITLICKGRSKRYIAETLFISENTVKAHTRNAYAKLDAHNKQDVLDMIGVK